MQKPLNVNHHIRVPQVQVIDDAGKQLGTMATSEALRLAKEQELDLVEVNPNAAPPIAKIMDYGKYIYRKEKQDRKAGARKEQERKTVKIGFKTGQHDLEIRARQAEEFLKEGDIVRIELTLRGREKALAEIGRQKLIKFMTVLKIEYATQDPIKRSPMGWSTIIVKK